jgi:hypothetical protein
MKQFETLLHESALNWGIGLRTARWLFWLPILASMVIFGLQVNRDIFRLLLLEDGPAEWLSAICLALAGLAALRIAFNRFKMSHPWQALLFIAVALVMLFAGGEEASWGQRVFGWETPQELADINDQEETNLHNIGAFLDITNVAMFLIGLYGTVAYMADQTLRLARRWDQGEYLFVPPLFLATYFLPILVFRIARVTMFTESNFTLNRLGEWAEMVVAVGLLLFFWFVSVRVTAPASNQDVAKDAIS